MFCLGCGYGIIVREVLNVVDGFIVLGNFIGCLEVCLVVYLYILWDVFWIYIGFENGFMVILGVEVMYKAFMNKGCY